MSPLVCATMTPVRRAKASDSDTGTQMMERTPPPQAVPHPFAGVACYTALRTDYLYTKTSIQDPRQETLSNLNRGRTAVSG